MCGEQSIDVQDLERHCPNLGLNPTNPNLKPVQAGRRALNPSSRLQSRMPSRLALPAPLYNPS